MFKHNRHLFDRLFIFGQVHILSIFKHIRVVDTMGLSLKLGKSRPGTGSSADQLSNKLSEALVKAPSVYLPYWSEDRIDYDFGAGADCGGAHGTRNRRLNAPNYRRNS